MKAEIPRGLTGRPRIWLTALLLTGCAVVSAPQPRQAPPANSGASNNSNSINSAVDVIRSDRADALIRDALVSYHRYRVLSTADAAREVNTQLDQKRNELSQLQLAILMAQVHGPGDLNRALQLLDSLSRQKTPDALALRPLVTLFSVQWTEQRRLEDQVDKLNQQVKDDQKRIDQLNEKLEGMKAIERNLQPRLPRPPGATG